jgi:polar amino acid transport system substrate-binding protein
MFKKSKFSINPFHLLCIFSLFLLYSKVNAAEKKPIIYRVGVAGSAPFVDDTNKKQGISVQLWKELAFRAEIQYKTINFNDVSNGLIALENGDIDILVGPISITAKRSELVKFTQPYFQSSLSILSRTDEPSVWERIKPLFSKKFFIAVCLFVLILSIVGTLLWLAERKKNTAQFPAEPMKGIGNGMWCAIVTMSTTGYGDIAPLTLAGRVVSGVWMVISIIFATTMVAGIASTLTLTGLGSSVVSTAEQLNNTKVAVVANSPAEDFAREFRAKITEVQSLNGAYTLLKNRKVDAIVYDRPQLLYFLKQHNDKSISVSIAEYLRQGYGFALPLNTDIQHDLNVQLLYLQESGQTDLIVREWLGEQ